MALSVPMLALTACDTSATDATGATASEARQLNDAAAMLEPDSVSANAVAGNDVADDDPAMTDGR